MSKIDANNTKIIDAILEMEAKHRLLYALSPVEARDLAQTIYAEDVIDVHGSGWIYKKDESILLRYNGSFQRKPPVVSSRAFEPEIRILTDDVVSVTVMTEVYYEVPDPQSLARAAGTLTMDPEARNRAAAEQITRTHTMWPGEQMAPNPLRYRTTRVWKRHADGWKVALNHATRVGPRATPEVY